MRPSLDCHFAVTMLGSSPQSFATFVLPARLELAPIEPGVARWERRLTGMQPHRNESCIHCRTGEGSNGTPLVLIDRKKAVGTHFLCRRRTNAGNGGAALAWRHATHSGVESPMVLFEIM